jgi:hypothetical protein
VINNDMLSLCESHSSFIDFISLYLTNIVAFRKGGRNINYISGTHITTIPNFCRLKLDQRFVKKRKLFVPLVINPSVIITAFRKYMP